MFRVLLLNPCTHSAATQSMVQQLQVQLPQPWHLTGRTAVQGVPVITNTEQLHASGTQVLRMWHDEPHGCHAIVVTGFGDPCVEQLRSLAPCPVISMGEACVRAASQGGRRFGIATTTPDLAAPMRALMQRMGVAHLFTGLSHAPGVPSTLAHEPTALEAALHYAAQACVQLDGAQAVIVHGGPLGRTAQALQAQQARYGVPIIAPLTATAQWLQQQAGHAHQAPSAHNA